jgi:hypothetical protein
LQARDELRRENRIPAGREEVVVDCHFLHVEDLPPELDEPALEGCPGLRAHRFPGRLWALDPEQLRHAEPLHLPGRAGRDFSGDRYDPRHLEVGQPPGNELLELVLGGGEALPRDDGGADLLAQPRVRDGEHDSLGHRGVGEQRVLDLGRRDLLSAPVDDLLAPPAEKEVTVAVEEALVAGAKPAVDEGALVRSRRAHVAAEDALAPDRHLAVRARR